MKKIGFLLMLVLAFTACNVNDNDDNNIRFDDVALPIESISMPSEFEYGQTYLIEYSYFRPSTCHSFVELLQIVNLNVRTIAVRSRVVSGTGECADFQDELESRSFNVTVDSMDTYIYKVWQGKDANGQDIYLQMEIPVIE